MSEFEFVQVTVALILGLGLTDILRNLGEQIRRRNEVAIFPVQVVASCLLLLVILLYLWFFWDSSEVATWTLPLFLLQTGPAIALALSAQVLKVDCNSAATPEAQYFGSCTAIYTSWALAPLIAIGFSFVAGQIEGLDFARLGIVALLLSLAFIKKTGYHKAILTTLLLTAVSTPFIVQFQL
jgi:hypothetical protein